MRPCPYLDEIAEWTCNFCGEVKPAHRFEKRKDRARSGRYKITGRCLECKRVYVRSCESGQRDQDREFELAPDRAPAEHMFELLVEARSRGQTFSEAWNGHADEIGCLEYVLSSLTGYNAEQWACAFASTREHWEAAYNREQICAQVLSLDLVAEEPDQVAQNIALVA